MDCDFFVQHLLLSYVPRHCDGCGGDTDRFQSAIRSFLPQDGNPIGKSLIPVVDAALFDGSAVQLRVRDRSSELTVTDAQIEAETERIRLAGVVQSRASS